MQDWLTLLPPALAIALAMWKREVIAALLVAILSAEFLLNGLHPGATFLAAVDRVAAVFESPDNTRILLFSLLIGAFLSLIRNSGGVAAFVHYLLDKGIARSRRSVSVLTTALGLGIFIESNLSVLASGIFAQRLFDRFGMSRARLAFMIDSTCSPVSILILMNAWGAYILGLLNGYGLGNPVGVLLGSIPLNFYALFMVAAVLYTAWSTRVHLALAAHEYHRHGHSTHEEQEPPTRIRYFLVPLGCLIGGIVGFMLYTGGGSLIAGSGARSVLYGTVTAVAVAFLLLRLDGVYRHRELIDLSFKGMSELLPLVWIVLLALALGSAMKDLGTGDFVSGMISRTLPFWLIAPVVFVAGCVIAFTTGTSWGTFALLIPVAIPIAVNTGLPPSLLLAAVLSGGVFGDHTSPISDSTILSSLASGCNHLDHVRTQLPYGLIGAALSFVLFIIFSF